MMVSMNAIERACESVGSQRALATAISVTPATVNQWCSGERPIPVDRCPSIEAETKGVVACDELRPDVSWVRIKDKAWPHPGGRPLADHSVKFSASDAAKSATQ